MDFDAAQKLTARVMDELGEVERAIKDKDTERFVRIYLKDTAKALLHSLIATKV